MGLLFDLLFGQEDNKKKTKNGTFVGNSEYSEEEMDSYGLFENEKEEVRKGNYAPWNFEEDGDLDEDDYYYEDDK